MIFANHDEVYKESQKERNLYFKVFAGLIFNELIFENKMPEKFMIKLKECYQNTCNEFSIETEQKVVEKLEQLTEDAKKEELSVSFDYHINQIMKDNNFSNDCKLNGEMADIFIGGLHSFIAIEAKYLSDFNFEKDIIKNHERISIAGGCFKNKFGIQVLLITREKRKHIKEKKSVKSSNYKKIQEWLIECKNENPFILMTWEDIKDILVQSDSYYDNVVNYMEDRLNIVPDTNL